nr:zinc finger, CCHC-type [Tanacetum cinerariifolium]
MMEYLLLHYRTHHLVPSSQLPSTLCLLALSIGPSQVVKRAETRETSESSLVRQLLHSRGRIGAAGSLTVGYLRNLTRGILHRIYHKLQGRFLVAQRKLKVKQLEGKTNTEYLVNKEVHHNANVEAVIIKTGVLGQESVEGNSAKKYRGDNNMAALGVIALIEEYAHESLTFRDVVSCEIIFKWIPVMKEDMDTRSSMCMLRKGLRQSSDDNNIYYWKYAPGMFIYLFLYIDNMGFTCVSKVEILVTEGLLDEAKEIILCMEIFRTQSSNTLRVSRFRFSNGISVR